MTSTFAIDVIRTFQEPEATDFRAFLESPYCNRGQHHETVKPFFEVLYSAIQNGEIEKIEKQTLHGLLFPDRPFVESKMDKLMSDLKQLVERFLLTQQYFQTQNEAQHLLDLSVEMRLRGLESRYHQTIEKTKRHPDFSGQESLKNLYYKYLLAREEQEWHSTYNKGKGDLNIPETVRSLDTYYFAHRTWMLNHWMFMEKATTFKGRLESLGQQWVVPENLTEKSIFLHICWEVHLLLSHPPSAEDFRTLLTKIQSNENLLSPDSLSQFYIYLRNFCVLMIESGQTEMHFVLHQINKDNLERNYFYLNGKISPHGYLNITQTALNVGEIAWAQSFVERHREIILGENETHDFYRMNKALCLFGEKKYQEALETIPFGSSYSAYHLMARRLELKIFYELRSELLDHKIDAFKMFISRAGRKVFSANLHILFTNFVNFVRQLNQSEGPQAKQRSQTLTKRISEKKMVAERLWLLEKARELGQKR